MTVGTGATTEAMTATTGLSTMTATTDMTVLMTSTIATIGPDLAPIPHVSLWDMLCLGGSS